MGSNHTPGPWSVHHDKVISQDTYDTIVHFGIFSDPARGHWTIETDAQNRANAALISASPDLLEAAREGLIAAEADVEDRRRELQEDFEGEAEDPLLPVLIARRDLIAAAIAKASPTLTEGK